MANKRNRVLQDAFIAAYVVAKGNKAKACRECGAEYRTVLLWFAKDKEFIERLEEARQQFHDLIWEALFERARTSSDQAAFFLMKSLFPERYDDNIRKLKYAKDNDIQEHDGGITINVHKGPLPERIKKLRGIVDEPE